MILDFCVNGAKMTEHTMLFFGMGLLFPKVHNPTKGMVAPKMTALRC